MDRLFSFSRPSRRASPFQWNITACLNGLFSLALLLGLSSLCSRNLDPALDQANHSTPRQLSSYPTVEVEGANQPKVILLPVTFDERRYPTILVDFPYFQSTDSASSGQVGIVTPTRALPESSSVLDPNDKKSYPSYTPRISNMEEAMVAMVRNSIVPGRLSSMPWRLDSATLGRNRTRSVTFLVGASLLLILGAVILKKALEKASRWDRQLQVDSLAYDMAYTDTRSYPGYGSFVSPASMDEFDRFDV